MAQPIWFIKAKSYLGLKEVVGPKHNPTIQKWLVNLRAWWDDDETPWCGVGMAQWMKESGLAYPKAYYRAKSWATWGVGIEPNRAGGTWHVPSLPFGAIVVFERPGGGHVGMVVGYNRRGDLMVLGANQGNAVTITPITAGRLVAVRWPVGTAFRPDCALPFYEDNATISENEA